MSGASWALQSAVFAALSADAALQPLIGDPARVFDAVPPLPVFPYVVIGDDAETNWDTAERAIRDPQRRCHGGSRLARCKRIAWPG